MLIVLLCVVAVGNLALGQSPIVTVSQGTMRGQIFKSRDGRDFFSFTKIPYAKPPVGERRYMLTGRYPVIFNIHGGAFFAGSAGTESSAKFFMDENVVFAAPNYRLGPLGFLSLEDNVVTGNMGLKDQALALEWVQQEISKFGGDPNLITVIGGSAGAASADIICSAPRTNGIIKACVSQSGVGLSPWVFMKPGVPRRMALNLARALGCNETGDVLKCLRSKPIEQKEDNAYLATPVLEPENAPGAILTKWPTGTNHNYPWIIGVVQDEGMVSTGDYEFHKKTQDETEKFINNFNEVLISTYNLQNRTKDVQKLRERYFKNGIEPLVAIRNVIFYGGLFCVPVSEELK
ncbi:venom carboxylesterase-6 [Halyomorpha halys]|uniref:venom carboxylesterase-6 n=1 Tax=Halyomorpha halys TaxID=286706 RepID=UPI0034D3717A